MRRTLRATAIHAALGMMLAGSVATAQTGPEVVAAAPSKPYRFRHSGMVAPAMLDGLPRTVVKSYGENELDLSAGYSRENELLTVYVFRNVSGGVPVWFDRARFAIEQRSAEYGTITAAVAPAAFTPPGQSSASGLMGAWSISKPPYRGTALAFVPIGEWYVKVRYSSAIHDGAALAARLPAVLAALTWPKRIAAAPATAPVADCATPLSFPTMAEPVRDAKALGMAAITSGVVATAAMQERAKAGAVTWCRDPVPAPVGGLYRANGATDAYLLALSDAGRGIGVAPDGIGEAVGKSEGKTVRQWNVALYELNKVINFPPMTALPRPDQLVDLLRGPAMSSASTWGRKTQIDINPAFLKDDNEKPSPTP
ncbi:hypothetical protein [Sphingomonas sp. VNH70]|uniref:hypothetical protein n=1 Tax=Sphingomonas silueang TaxID=3156617 RepID=UPI0032B3A2DA